MAVEGGQTPFVIAHSNVFTPKPKAVTVVTAEVGDVIVPVPEIKVQPPIPIVGTFPFIVAVGFMLHSV